MSVNVYIVADLEGCLGVTGPDPTNYSSSSDNLKLKKKWSEQCTIELNSMIRGLNKEGAEYFYVIEGHPGCLIPDMIEFNNVELAFPGKYGSYLPKSHENWIGVWLLGHHTKEGTENGFLAHTMSIRNPQRWYINGEEVGEVGIIKKWMSEVEVPILHVTGGDRLREEVINLDKNIVFSTTKTEIEFLKAIDRPIQSTLKAIEKDAASALCSRQNSKPKFTKSTRVYRKFIVKTYRQAVKVILFVTFRSIQSKGIIKPKGIFGHEVNNGSVRNAINLLLGFRGKI